MSLRYFKLTGAVAACALAAFFLLAERAAAQTFTVLHGFSALRETADPFNVDGDAPQAQLILSGTTLYGTAYAGGSNGYGTVFKVNINGTGYTTLHSFAGAPNDGAGPSAGLVLSGNTLYGTTSGLGLYNFDDNGTVFAVNTDGTGFTNLYSFTGGADGGGPVCDLVLSGSTLYGTAPSGGAWSNGTVFAVGTNGRSFTNLYSFTAGSVDINTVLDITTNDDGTQPSAGLILSGDVLYGTAKLGGTNGTGTIFAIHTDGSDFTNLHNLSAFYYESAAVNQEGAYPAGRLVLSGNTLYGTASAAGTDGSGTVFAIHTDSTGFTNLYEFSFMDQYPLTADGAYPLGALTLSGGTLYGTASTGGTNNNGTIFTISTNGTGFETVYTFSSDFYVSATNSDGVSPAAGLCLSGSALYGTAQSGGALGEGTVFTLNTSGGGFDTLHTFTTPQNELNSDGADPPAGLVLVGNRLFGTTKMGGLPNLALGQSTVGVGTVFAVNTDGTGFTNFHSIAGGSDGADPWAGLTASGSVLYGTTAEGGSNGVGTVFAINTNGSDFTNLSSFNGGTAYEPAYPYPLSGVVSSGNVLYGATSRGGNIGGNGAIYSVATNGIGLTNIYIFSFATQISSGLYTNYDGLFPWCNLVLSGSTLYGTATDGGLYGNGTVFAVSTHGTNFVTLHPFGPTLDAFYTNSQQVAYYTNADGITPYAGLVLSGNTLYGTAFGGGIDGNGTVFSVNSDGTGFAVLHAFTAAYGANYTNSDGANPYAGLVLSGNTLYGTTQYGGASGNGTVFSLNTGGTNFTTLYTFTDGNDGANPQGQLVLSGDTLYGTASAGGVGGEGSVFSLSLSSTPAPSLKIGSSGANVILSWPASATGFVLQTTTNLIAPMWVNSSQTPSLINGDYSVTSPITGTRQFFRLEH